MDSSFSDLDDSTFFQFTDDVLSLFAPLSDADVPQQLAGQQLAVYNDVHNNDVVHKEPRRKRAPETDLSTDPNKRPFRFVFAPFPPMETDPATLAFNTELLEVQRMTLGKEKQSKNIFVRKEFVNQLIKQREAKDAEIRKLEARLRQTEDFWKRQTLAALPRLAAIGSLIKTHVQVAQGMHYNTITKVEAASMLQGKITALLPTDMACEVQKLVRVLAPHPIKVAIKIRASRIDISIRFPKPHMSSKSPTTTSSAMAVSTATSWSLSSSVPSSK